MCSAPFILAAHPWLQSLAWILALFPPNKSPITGKMNSKNDVQDKRKLIRCYDVGTFTHLIINNDIFYYLWTCSILENLYRWLFSQGAYSQHTDWIHPFKQQYFSSSGSQLVVCRKSGVGCLGNIQVHSDLCYEERVWMKDTFCQSTMTSFFKGQRSNIIIGNGTIIQPLMPFLAS